MFISNVTNKCIYVWIGTKKARIEYEEHFDDDIPLYYRLWQEMLEDVEGDDINSNG